MVKASELTIGNLVLSGKGIYNLIAISEPFCMGEVNGKAVELDCNLISPIELTPEILLKCGFGVVHHIHGYSFFTTNRKKNKEMPPIDWYENRTLFYGYSVNHCKYLHQLQNLYHSLTGNELEINL